ncbi:hypothetical protein [Candidatus Poriferisocius sp.]|uniref:hypothetical protein n=1 Tax=Candidatus Poriferisocius sp. TaxID=3101276 RepID=UPI003B52DCDB
MGKKLWSLVTSTPRTRRGRIASGAGSALLVAAMVFPTIAFDLGYAAFAIFAPLAVVFTATVLWLDRVPGS